MATASEDEQQSSPEAPSPVSRSAAPPWASGIVTGVETAVLSAGLVYAFVFAVVASAPSVDGSIAADWSGAWDVGTSIWLLAHGVPATVGDVAVTLLPLGLMLAIGVIAASVARRVAVPAHASVLSAAFTYGVIAAIVSASDHGGAGSVWKAGIVGGLITGMGASFGLMRGHGFRFFEGVALPRIAGLGLRLGVGAWAMCLGAGTAVAVIWQASAADRMAGVVEGVAPDLAGGLALAAGETAYVPNLAVWGLSWLTGEGFQFGSGSRYSPGEVVAGPTPDVPLIASLPQGSGGLLVAAPLILVIVGMVSRAAARRWLPSSGTGYAAQAVAVGVVGSLTWGIVVLASGSAGGGALVEVGPTPLPVSLAVAGLVGAGFLLVSVGFEAARRVDSRSRSRGARRGAGRVGTTAPEPPPRIPPSNDPLRLW
ncbi:MAG: hypothetical protein JW722_04750 [Demequinaceae bacterium]|nr:hypothetical protein [Demequinaceae bacterium]